MDTTAHVSLDLATPESVVAALDEHVDMWSHAEVVAIGWTARTVHELHVVAHGLVRLLVGRLGLRSVLIEGDREVCRKLDGLVRNRTDDLQRTLAGARPFLATVEMLDVLRWLQRWNDGNGAERARIVHGGQDDLSSPLALERSLANQVLLWHDRLGHRIIYLGGAYHTAAAGRTMAAATSDPLPSAGSLLRDALGDRYLSVGLTFGSGTIPQPVPSPAPGTLEADLDALGRPTVLVQLRSLLDARTSIVRPDRVRIVGPDYKPDNDASHSMVGDPAQWFDFVIHQQIGTPTTFLT
jgi:erythromycin esterase